jgi:hypothetical protein
MANPTANSSDIIRLKSRDNIGPAIARTYFSSARFRIIHYLIQPLQIDKRPSADTGVVHIGIMTTPLNSKGLIVCQEGVDDCRYLISCARYQNATWKQNTARG